jgi:class 3 adenylate cyclase
MASSDSAKESILVVDDTPENVDVLAGVLSRDYRIKVALSGNKALQIAQQDDPPDLILLDVMMPEMDGYEVCRQLKQNAKTRDIPVIFVTAKTEVADETKGLELGAVDYLTKPISPPVVQARVRTHLALQESRGRLKDLSVKLSRYLSPQIYQSIFEGRTDARIAANRKKLTIFFSDIVGFAMQTDRMEPEDLNYVLNGYLTRMSDIILAHGGTLDKFIGDAILVFFGDPESRGVKEDALGCVRMALSMRTAIEELRKEWAEHGVIEPFAVRTGIATGYCTVGNFGSEQRMEYTIVGGQVNLANRLQSSAAPGEILLAHETWTLVKDEFYCLPKEPFRVKGFEHPVHAWQVVDFQANVADRARIEDARPGFHLTLDPSNVNPEDKRTILERLQAAIASLR